MQVPSWIPGFQDREFEVLSIANRGSFYVEGNDEGSQYQTWGQGSLGLVCRIYQRVRKHERWLPEIRNGERGVWILDIVQQLIRSRCGTQTGSWSAFESPEWREVKWTGFDSISCRWNLPIAGHLLTPTPPPALPFSLPLNSPLPSPSQPPSAHRPSPSSSRPTHDWPPKDTTTAPTAHRPTRRKPSPAH